ncbi:MAG: LacI family DNA-binding transcriptional regulator [Armatimonadetes bacterium]|nr:LacI family DNA-binding transcriptional regulator [Armatimonadota bacterium]
MEHEREPQKRVTLSDVAREAGVSVQTASHVMSGNLSVRLPDSTRERVRAAAERVGYQPNRLAQAMKRGKTNVIGVWLPIDRMVPNYLRMLHQIDLQARKTGYEIMISGLHTAEALTPGGRPPTMWPVDAVIAIDSEKAVESLRSMPGGSNVPVIVLGFQQFENSDSVTWDLAGAAKLATERLIARGCRRIVHVSLDWVLEKFPREQRRRGYIEAMEAAGLPLELLGASGESSWASERAVHEYLATHGAPDAFCCFTDPLAIGAGRALLASGVRIPEQCKVWGFGDYPESEEYVVPISTIRIPLDKVIEQAWRLMLQRIENGRRPSELSIYTLELVERESTR